MGAPTHNKVTQTIKIKNAFDEEILFLICSSNPYLSSFSRPSQDDPILTKKRPQKAWKSATETGRPGNFLKFNSTLFQLRLYLGFLCLFFVPMPDPAHQFLLCKHTESRLFNPICCSSVVVFQISSFWTAELIRKIITSMHQRKQFVKFHSFRMTVDTCVYMCVFWMIFQYVSVQICTFHRNRKS